ncbi:MAG: response regulator transcription factor [Elusimicrobiota bacterium]|nr:response regulator transcription factor [Elusimicrobiota bacterium]
MAKLLIIEDDGELQQVLSVVFQREGYELHYAFNGKEGYDKMIAVQPDIVLLDLMLPVLNGVEVLKLVVTNTSLKDIPIIVMTAHGDKADMLEHSIKAQGVRAYLRKPFELSEIRFLVRRMLTQYPRNPVTASQVAKGEVRLDVKFRTVWVSDRMVATLSPMKASVLQVLLESKGPVKREKILHAVWDDPKAVPALEKTIQRLREDLGAEGRRLQTTAEGYEIVG